MLIPDDRKYSVTHEWAKVEGDKVRVGISDHAQEELGDVVYLDLPEVGRVLTKGDVFGAVESVKAVSDLYAPVSGEVVEANTDILNRTERVNESAYDEGWIILIRMSDPTELDSLLDSDAYRHMVEEASH